MADTGLSSEQIGLLNYLHSVLAQPLGRWDGFYAPQSPSMNFALRYQLAFGAYAVAALSQGTPAYCAPYAEALRGAIEKMLHVEAWGYWRAPSGDMQQAASSGHVAVLLSPHRQVPAGPPSDPIAQDNLQYSGHLSTMLGLYEKVSGDTRFDEPFTLRDPESGVAYSYTHSEVAGRIHTQMRESSFGGVCCESGVAYVPCNNHALASNALHDALHGTSYRDANGRWLNWVRGRMVLHGPASRGVFGAAYVKDLHMAAPVAFNFTDAWGIALMLPFDPTLARKLYRRFRRKISHNPDDAYLDSSALSEKMEISDVAINTGFALVAARGAGDLETAEKLERYIRTQFGARWNGRSFSLLEAPRALHSTALYALASAVDPGGRNFANLFNDPPTPLGSTTPSLASVSSSDGGPLSVGVSNARYEPDSRTLSVVLTGTAGFAPSKVSLRIENLSNAPSVSVNGTPTDFSELPGTSLSIAFNVTVPPGGATTCVIHP